MDDDAEECLEESNIKNTEPEPCVICLEVFAKRGRVTCSRACANELCATRQVGERTYGK